MLVCKISCDRFFFCLFSLCCVTDCLFCMFCVLEYEKQQLEFSVFFNWQFQAVRYYCNIKCWILQKKKKFKKFVCSVTSISNFHVLGLAQSWDRFHKIVCKAWSVMPSFWEAFLWLKVGHKHRAQMDRVISIKNAQL